MRIFVAIYTLILTLSGTCFAQDLDDSLAQNEYEKSTAERLLSEPWGVAIGFRRADIPYQSDDRDVYDIIPLLYYQNDHFYIRGLEAGAYLWKNGPHQFNLYSRFRFVDIPKSQQNELQSDAFDLGGQYRYFYNAFEFDTALLSDSNSRQYAYIRGHYYLDSPKWQLVPFAALKWKSQKYNRFYYANEKQDVSGGISMSAGIKARYHVSDNLYLLGQFGVTRLEDKVKALPNITHQYQFETFLGVGFFPGPDKKNQRAREDKEDEFIRFAYAWATPSNISEITGFSARKDPFGNTMSSLFYGVKLSDELFSLPIELYFTPGAVWHHHSSVQNDLAEGIVAIKAFYTFEYGPRWRIGFAEGLSYLTSMTYVERSELAEKDFRPSKLLNYLDFSFDVNAGDVLGNERLKALWIGYSIHHRSGMFESSSAFGRISGGSNYQSVTAQWHY